MRLLCLCPTYGRPTLLENSVALFQRQEYPKDKCKLLVLDDAGQYQNQKEENWEIVSFDKRFESMPKKYQALFKLEDVLSDDCQWDAVVIWDDDDLYLPNHLQAHADQLERFPWSQPERVYCAYYPIKIEPVRGNMWASLAVSTSFMRKIDPHKWDQWFRMREAAFDFSFLAMLDCAGGRSPELSFMFRWYSTGVPHLQNFIRNGEDTTTYMRFPQHETRFVDKLIPKLDIESERNLGKFKKGLLPK